MQAVRNLFFVKRRVGSPDSRENRHARRLVLALGTVGAFGTAMIAGSLLWNLSLVRENTFEEARIQARVAHDEDIVYRRWNSRHGGVYVRVTSDTPPNPYLAGVKDRDVVTADGTILTLVNPAYMTRQAHEFSVEDHKVTSHLTSLDPIRPANAPDDWERDALLAFETGVPEVSSIVAFADGPYLRLMKPMVTEQECLRCHTDQGYTVGSVRGGISVAVPMAPLLAMQKQNVLTLSLAHAVLWVVGFAALLVGGRTLLRAERARAAAEEETARYARELEESNRLKDLFTDIMRHDLINPAGIINCYAEFIMERETDVRTREYGKKIKLTAERLTRMIDEASRFTELRDLRQIECRPMDLGQILNEAVGEFQDRCGDSGVQVVLSSPESCPLRANPMIGNVFSNLLSNTLKYAAEGERVEIDIVEDSRWWTTSVRDYGAGIADDDKERIFCRFERLRKEGVRGSGLGLAISRHLVELHHGVIWVEDNPAGGAVFMVRLPKAGPRPELLRPNPLGVLAEAVPA